MTTMTYKNRPYAPVRPPSGDTEALSNLGDRLMFTHDRGGSRLVVAPKGLLHYGLVLGVFDLENVSQTDSNTVDLIQRKGT